LWGVIEDSQTATIENANAELAELMPFINSKYEDAGISFNFGTYEMNGDLNSFDFNAISEGIYFVVLLDDMGRLIKNQVIFQSK